MIALLYILAISLFVLTLIARVLPKQHAHLISGREYAAITLLPILAAVSPHYAVFCVLVLAFIAFIPATPEQRFRLFFFSIHLLPAFLYVVPAPPPINQLVPVTYYLLLSLGCLSLVFAAQRRAKAQMRRWDILVFLLLCGLLLAYVKDTTITNAMREILTVALLLGLFYLVVSRGMTVMRSPSDLLLSIVFGAAILAAITTFEAQRNWLLYDTFTHRFGLTNVISAYAKQRGGFLRASATFPESTSLSLFLSLAVVMLIALRKKLARPLAFYVLLGILLVGLFFTLARVGFLAAGIGILALLWYRKRYGLFAAGLIGGPLAYLFLDLLAPYVPVLGAMFGESGDGAVTTDYRTRLASRMYEEFLQEPWFGLTTSEIAIRLDDMRQGEGIIDLVNTPLAVALQSGIVGLVLFLVPPIALLVTLARLRRHADGDQTMAAGAIFASIVALQAGLVTTSFQGPNQIWTIGLLGLGIGLCAVVRLAARREAEPPVEQHRETALAAAE